MKWLKSIAVALIFLAPISSHAAFVQKVALTALSGGTTLSGTITGVVAGHSIFFLASYFPNGSAVAASAPTDSNGTFTVGFAPTPATDGAGNHIAGAVYINLSAASGSHTVSLTLPAGSFAQGEIVEWSNITSATADKTSNTNTTIAITSSVSTTTLTQANEVAFAVMATVTNTGVVNAGISDPPTGFTSLAVANDTAANIGAEFAYKETVATTALTAAYSWTDANGGTGDTEASQTAIATFKETGGGGGAVQQKTMLMGIGARATPAPFVPFAWINRRRQVAAADHWKLKLNKRAA